MILNSESEYISGCATCTEYSSGDDFLGLPLSDALQERCYYRVPRLILPKGIRTDVVYVVLVRLYVRTRRRSSRASNSLPWATYANRFCYCKGPGFTTRALSSAIHQHRSTGAWAERDCNIRRPLRICFAVGGITRDICTNLAESRMSADT